MCSRPLAKALNQFLPEDQLAQRLQLLIDYKADVNETDRFGRTHLQKSAEYGTSSSLDELLLAHGTDFNRRAYDYVCVSSFLNKCSARCLLPLLKIVDKNGRTPLMDAARKRGIHMLDLLTSKIPAASINMQDYQGRTALMWSVIEQITPNSFFSVNRDSVKLLLDRGARVDIQDKAGMSVLMHTTNNIINDETLELLFELAGNQITDSDLENTIKYVQRRIEEYRNHDSVSDVLRDHLELMQAEYARRVHSSTAGLSSKEHAKINAKLWRSERSEIARLQALIPRHEESGGGKDKVGAINALIAEFIVGPNPSSSDEVAIQEDEKEDAQNGRELFGDFDIRAQRSSIARAASLGAEPISAGDDGMGLGVVAVPSVNSTV